MVEERFKVGWAHQRWPVLSWTVLAADKDKSDISQINNISVYLDWFSKPSGMIAMVSASAQSLPIKWSAPCWAHLTCQSTVSDTIDRNECAANSSHGWHKSKSVPWELNVFIPHHAAFAIQIF